jgi:alkanesulfonate monooxygenase SsuD/methylene tetrahydromethanopterin reductase-like flavin-dependent oxidoreductase (luciferase family)
MNFGVWLPSYAYRDGDRAHMRRLDEYIARLEDNDIDIWVIDHLLHAEGLYGMSWLEPMSVLTYAAARTRKARLGTGILVLPLRNPVLLAKEIATLDYMSNGRFIFGIGPGWYQPEFESVGTKIEERGGRTDEILAAVRRLLSEESVTFEGRYYKFKDVSIEPRPKTMPQIWVSGGSRLPDPEYHDVPVLAKTVLERIVGADAWLSRCSGTQEFVKRDWEQVKSEVIRRRGSLDGFTFAHCNFIYLVDTDDQEKAHAAQRRPFEEVMGDHRPFEQLQQCYFLGTPAQQLDRLRDLASAGCEYLVLGPTSDEPEQLELLIEKLIKPSRAGVVAAR